MPLKNKRGKENNIQKERIVGAELNFAFDFKYVISS